VLVSGARQTGKSTLVQSPEMAEIRVEVLPPSQASRCARTFLFFQNSGVVSVQRMALGSFTRFNAVPG
jgi:hypothetical protein